MKLTNEKLDLPKHFTRNLIAVLILAALVVFATACGSQPKVVPLEETFAPEVASTSDESAVVGEVYWQNLGNGYKIMCVMGYDIYNAKPYGGIDCDWDHKVHTEEKR